MAVQIFVRIFAPTKPAPAGRAGQDIEEILRPTKPFVGLAEGKRAFTDVIFCVFKLRNFESVHRGNATVNACVGELYPDRSYIIIMYS